MGFHFKIDSMVVVCCINKQKSCNYEIFKINKIFWLFCKKGNCGHMLHLYHLNKIKLQMQNQEKSGINLNGL